MAVWLAGCVNVRESNSDLWFWKQQPLPAPPTPSPLTSTPDHSSFWPFDFCLKHASASKPIDVRLCNPSNRQLTSFRFLWDECHNRAAYVSFGGLLMRLQGEGGNLHGFEVDKTVYLLMKKLAFWPFDVFVTLETAALFIFTTILSLPLFHHNKLASTTKYTDRLENCRTVRCHKKNDVCIESYCLIVVEGCWVNQQLSLRKRSQCLWFRMDKLSSCAITRKYLVNFNSSVSVSLFLCASRNGRIRSPFCGFIKKLRLMSSNMMVLWGS